VSVCEKFSQFQGYPDVCEHCGELAENHPSVGVGYSEFREAIWNVLIKHGGVRSFYGGYDSGDTAILKAHMLGEKLDEPEMWSPLFRKDYEKALKSGPCGIDWDWTEEPCFDDRIAEFSGTFATSDYYVCGVRGMLHCKCGVLRWKDVTLLDKTLGQVIWLTVHEGDDK
jgi:hypothetical protein